MLGGRKVVFLSCMHLYKEQLAAPIRDRLNELGYHAVIVEDEPLLRGSFDPETKVDSYIEASDAFVALCTQDDRVPGNTAQNIIDEIGRARAHPRLRDVVCVLKEPQITLPSNIYPVAEPLNRGQPVLAFEVIRRQLQAWEIEPTSPLAAPAAPSGLRREFLDQLFDGVRLGDHDKAEERLRTLFNQITKENQRRVASVILDYTLAAPAKGDQIHVATSFLEATARLDATLVSAEWIERLAASPTVPHRMSAAMLLWDLAETAPGIVPIDLVAKLAKPATEDWYVFAPALGAAKQLALTRRSALHIILDLAQSGDAENRLAAVQALSDVTRVDATLVPMRPVQKLCDDADEGVSEAAQKLRSLINEVPKKRRGGGYRTFSL